MTTLVSALAGSAIDVFNLTIVISIPAGMPYAVHVEQSLLHLLAVVLL